MALPLFDQLYNLAHWLTGDRADAEDLVQETYAKALKGIKSFQEGTNFRAWMYRILRNTFLTSRSGLKVQNTAFLDDEESDAAVPAHSITPEFIALQVENSQMVINAIADLPIIYREVILLCDVEELSYKEIAQVLSVPIGDHNVPPFAGPQLVEAGTGRTYHGEVPICSVIQLSKCSTHIWTGNFLWILPPRFRDI